MRLYHKTAHVSCKETQAETETISIAKRSQVTEFRTKTTASEDPVTLVNHTRRHRMSSRHPPKDWWNPKKTMTSYCSQHSQLGPSTFGTSCRR